MASSAKPFSPATRPGTAFLLPSLAPTGRNARTAKGADVAFAETVMPLGRWAFARLQTSRADERPPPFPPPARESPTESGTNDAARSTSTYPSEGAVCDIRRTTGRTVRRRMVPCSLQGAAYPQAIRQARPGRFGEHIARAQKYDAMNPSAVLRWMVTVRVLARLGCTPTPCAGGGHACRTLSARPPRQCASLPAEIARDRLRSVIAELPPLRAEVVAMRCFGNMSVEEIASIVGATRKDIVAMLRDARRLLQRMLSARRIANRRPRRACEKADEPAHIAIPGAYLPP